MLAAVENETLLVNLIGIDQRNRNAIEMVFNKKQFGPCVFANAEKASLTIVDLDKYGAEDEWAALQQIKPDQLAIFLSIDEARRNTSHLFIKKPVSIMDFVSSLENARTKLVPGVFTGQRKGIDWGKLFSSGLNKLENQFSTTKKNCDKENAQKEIVFLSEQGYLLEEVKRAVVEASSEGYGIKLQFDHDQARIFIDPAKHWVNTDLTSESLKDICQSPLNENEVIKRVFSSREFSKYLQEWRYTKLKPVDIDSFLWDMALWTYRGALPVNANLNEKIILIYWPDLPRLTPIPNATRIAALWESCPMTLKETIDVLNIPQEDVFNFYVAANTLGLVRQSEQAEKPSETEMISRSVIKSDQNQREFYLRILEHLKGHNFDP